MPQIERKFRHCCFTLNNYVEAEDVPRISAWLTEEAKYWIIGREVGDSGTPHLQGYASFRGRHTFSYVRDKLGTRCHIESARGTARQNREYCSKGGEFEEGGSINEGKSGGTRDEQARQFMAAVGSGDKGVAAFADSFPGAYIFNGSNMLRNALSLKPPIERPGINVKWISGKPGVGKSRLAHELLPEAYVKDPRTKWWNGYLCQTDVIIDDFGPGGIDINHLLRWFDRYKCMVETKGGMVALHATNIIVTSNFVPSEIFKWGDELHPQIPALERRIVISIME
ncbi:replication-associated protein [Blackfly DNA Virus 4]|uniref:Replication-associated protein n=1 Tax=Blackfly DNA Virus 4 TaxID=2586184 RepID=A0A4Y5QKT7_9VIRU|nr:replication-associated protein [Blackfly DNA Virus 4]